jgi:hypothetical protein
MKSAPQLGIARIATEQANSLRRTLVTSTAAILAGALSGPAVFAPSTARASDGTSLHEARLNADHTVAFNNALKTTVIGGASAVTHLLEVSP